MREDYVKYGENGSTDKKNYKPFTGKCSDLAWHIKHGRQIINLSANLIKDGVIKD